MTLFISVIIGCISACQHAHSNNYITTRMEVGGGSVRYVTAYSRYFNEIQYLRHYGKPYKNFTIRDVQALWQLGYFDSPFPIVGSIEHLTIGERTSKEEIQLFSRIRTLISIDCENTTLTDTDLSSIPPQPHLLFLDISGCRNISAEGIAFASPARMLEVRLCHTNCGENLAKVIGNSDNLKTLDLSGSKTTHEDIEEIFKQVTKCKYLNISHTPSLGRHIGTAINKRVWSITIDEPQLEDLDDKTGSLEGVTYLTVSSTNKNSLSDLAWLRRIDRMTDGLSMEDVDVIHQGRNLESLKEAILKAQSSDD